MASGQLPAFRLAHAPAPASFFASALEGSPHAATARQVPLLQPQQAGAAPRPPHNPAAAPGSRSAAARAAAAAPRFLARPWTGSGSCGPSCRGCLRGKGPGGRRACMGARGHGACMYRRGHAWRTGTAVKAPHGAALPGKLWRALQAPAWAVPLGLAQCSMHPLLQPAPTNSGRLVPLIEAHLLVEGPGVGAVLHTHRQAMSKRVSSGVGKGTIRARHEA